MLPSSDEELGHRNLDSYKGEAGVYVTPHMRTAFHYAAPQVLFQDGVYWRLLYQLAANGRYLHHKRDGGNQYVFPSSSLQITHVWVQPCAQMGAGERVHVSWNPLLECRFQPFSPRPDDVATVTSGIL